MTHLCGRNGSATSKFVGKLVLKAHYLFLMSKIMQTGLAVGDVGEVRALEKEALQVKKTKKKTTSYTKLMY